MALAALEERPHNKPACRWQLAPANPGLAAALCRGSGVSNLLAMCAINRGWTSPEALAANLAPRLKNLSDPFRLPGMAECVARLFTALEKNEHIVVFGDYDVDGITACALLQENLSALGWKACAHIPHRVDDGYGLSEAGVAKCLEQSKPRILLAADCGSSSAAVIDSLQADGIDVLVLDHHQLGAPAPRPCAFVNPRIAGEFTELCSVGLAFKLCHALVKHGRERGLSKFDAHDIRASLDLVALGTIADQVPLTGENRALVHAGLQRLNHLQRPGLKALAEVAQVRGSIGTYEVGFLLAPRLNASGRLESARASLDLLIERSPERALKLAGELDQHNRRRQEIERRIADEAIAQVRSKFDPARDFVIVEGAAPWHIGVVGIVASRVLREFYRPTIILGGEGEEWRGSGRSIEGFDLAASLRGCADLLARHGGHAMAAGLSMNPSNLEPLRARLNEMARAALSPEDLQPLLHLDGEVALSGLDVPTARSLQALEPFGQGNPCVRLSARRLRIIGAVKRMGQDQQHARFLVSDGPGSAQVVWWNCAGVDFPAGEFDLAFEPQINTYQERESLQLKLLDWKPSVQGAEP